MALSANQIATLRASANQRATLKYEFEIASHFPCIFNTWLGPHTILYRLYCTGSKFIPRVPSNAFHTDNDFRYLMTTRRDDEQRRKQPDYSQKGELDRSHDHRTFISHRYASQEESPEPREVWICFEIKCWFEKKFETTKNHFFLECLILYQI